MRTSVRKKQRYDRHADAGSEISSLYIGETDFTRTYWQANSKNNLLVTFRVKNRNEN